MLTPERLSEIGERERKSTKGPWKFHRQSGQPHVLSAPDPTNPRGGTTVVLFKPCQLQDADFIAHARTDIPALLQHIAEQAAALAEKSEEWGMALKRLQERTLHYLAEARAALRTARDTIQELYVTSKDRADGILEPGPRPTMAWEEYVTLAPEMLEIDVALAAGETNNEREKP